MGATPVNVRLPPKQIAALDSWIATLKQRPSRPAALRMLMELALAAAAEQAARDDEVSSLIARMDAAAKSRAALRRPGKR